MRLLLSIQINNSNKRISPNKVAGKRRETSLECLLSWLTACAGGGWRGGGWRVMMETGNDNAPLGPRGLAGRFRSTERSKSILFIPFQFPHFFRYLFRPLPIDQGR